MIGKPSALTLLVSLLAVVALIGTGVALAQTYPPPVGSLTATSESTTPAATTNTVLSATVRDGQGNPIGEANVTFTIVDQPGDDASLGSLSETVKSNDNGVATVTLFTGSTPGQIVIEVTSGEKTAQLTLTVGVGGAPPAAPKTGGPPPTDDGGTPAWLIAVFIGAGLLGGGAALTMLARRRGKV